MCAIPEGLFAGPPIEGLDAAAGLFNSGGNEGTYAGTLRRFAADFERHGAEIARSLADGDLKAFSLKLHALKGLFATMGAAGLSASAHGLEIASRGGDAAACERDAPGFCAGMRALGEALRETPAAAPQKAVPKVAVGLDEAKRTLAALRAACLEGDCDAADAAAARLGAMSPAAQCDGALDEIRALADSLDYGAAVEKIDALSREMGKARHAQRSVGPTRESRPPPTLRPR